MLRLAQTGTRQAISDEKTVTCLTTMYCFRLLDQTILCHNMLFISGQRCTYMFCSQLNRFLAELEKRYDWSQEDYEAEWETAKSNPKAVWSKDDYGVPVVSLLRTTTASTAREISHRKGISTTNTEETTDVEATFKGVSTKPVNNSSHHQSDSDLEVSWFLNKTSIYI